MNKWYKRYLNLAKEVSTWSKDPNTKVGAVVVGSKGQILSQGYNGFPRGIKDTNDRLNDREKKYKFVVHAEQNCIYNATLNGVSLDGNILRMRIDDLDRKRNQNLAQVEPEFAQLIDYVRG